MKGNRFIVIGLGEIGQPLLKRLSKEFAVTCITRDEGHEEILKELKREDVEVIVGDATSRLVLEDARVDEADAVIITTTTERTNIEIAGILRENFKPRRVVSVGLTQKGVETLEGLGVEVENIFTNSAIGIRNKLEQRSKTAHAIGIGKDEILEVEVHQSSRLANKRLDVLNPIRWRIGVIYRDGNIVVPKPDTILRPKDRVVILGDPAVLKTVSEILTFSFQQFPLEYGSRAIVYMRGREGEGFFEEINYIFSVLPFQSAVLLCHESMDPMIFDEVSSRISMKNLAVKKTVLSPLGAVKAAVEEAGGVQGLVVLSDAVVDATFGIFAGTKKRNLILDILRLARCPVLIARGTSPYEKVGVSCTGKVEVEHLIDAALSISSSLNNEVVALQVRPSRYIAGEEDINEFEENKKAISDISIMYKSSVNTLILDGNPVKAITDAAGGLDLVLLDAGGIGRGGRLHSFFEPDVTWGIAAKAPASTFIIPSIEEAL